ncbi:BcBOA8 protein [Leptodontidium sp. 2 PMI_412]|nr:BcBOA8 protein [Leptodontidium sp. 2 PMI_412]
MAPQSSDFKVIVVGGGITGLALACSLERAGIQYVVLESRDEVAPQVGASIAMLPNGMRLLDQLGILEKVRAGAVKHEIIFFERQKLQQELYNAITDKSKFLTGRKVNSVEHREEEVVVKCENGEVYRGDVLLGADGTHSFVRSEMRKLIDEKDDKLLKGDKKSQFVEYSCLYGISTPTPGIETATMHRAYNRGLSCLTVGGVKDTYWFLYKRLDKKYYPPNIPRYTQADADTQAAEYMDFVVGGTDGKVTIGDMWKRKKVGGLQAMDEGQNDHWTFGRIACVGDSAHKVTANAGTGGNLCLEGAAAVTNSLTKEKKTSTQKPDFKAVETALRAYHDGRKVRAKEQVKGANAFTRIEDFYTLKDEMFAKYFAPNSGGLLMDLFSDGLVGATKFDFLPVPEKALGVNMPYNVNYGITKGEALWKRAFFALPLLGVFYLARRVLVLDMPEKLGPLMVETFTEGRMQLMSFLTDYFAFNAIWMIESCRRGNIFTFARLPTIFLLLAQLFGIGVVAPIYFFLHYIFIPSTKFHAADNRQVPIHLVKTMLPTLVLGYVLPTVAMYWPTSPISTLQAWNFIWQPFPIYLSILHRILSRLLPNNERADRINNIKGDLFYLRLIYLTTALLSSSIWIYTFLTSPTPLFQVFLSGLLNTEAKFKTLEECIGMFLKYDEVFCFGSAAIWVLLCFWDLKREGRLTAGWAKVLVVFGGMSLGLGPGAGLVGMWGWREDILARPGLGE